MITILGPTACGKTTLAVALAKRIGGEILSADSRQVYRRMDIGTGKDLSEYDGVPYHLIDICEPGTKYNLFQYLQDFAEAYKQVTERGAEPILCGGTGLYIEAVLKNYQLSPVPQNPELRKQLEGKSLEELTVMLRQLKERNGTHMHNTTDVDTAQRAIRAIEIEAHPHPSPREGSINTSLADNTLQCNQAPLPWGGDGGGLFGLLIPRDLRRERITQRLKARLEEGMVDEVRGLLDEGIPAEDLTYYGLEYKYVTEYVTGQLSYDEIKAFKPELLINAVTLKYTIPVFKEVIPYLPKECIISDIASVKTDLKEFYESTGMRYVSTHPMFGPTFANLQQLSEENAIIISEGDYMGRIFFKDLYQKLGLNIYEYTFEEHDKTVAYSLSIPFVSTFVFAAVMKHQDAPGTTFKRHMRIAKGVLNEDDYLLQEILFNPYTHDQVAQIRTELKELLEIIDNKDADGMKGYLTKIRNNVKRDIEIKQ